MNGHYEPRNMVVFFNGKEYAMKDQNDQVEVEPGVTLWGKMEKDDQGPFFRPYITIEEHVPPGRVKELKKAPQSTVIEVEWEWEWE